MPTPKHIQRCIFVLAVTFGFEVTAIRARTQTFLPNSYDQAISKPLPKQFDNFISTYKEELGRSRPVSAAPSSPPMWVIVHGLLLALNSGFLNGCCLSGGVMPGTNQAVAAVTGTYTTSAVGLAKGNWEQFSSPIKILLSFMAGSALAGSINPYPKTGILSPTWGPTLFLAAGLSAIANEHISRTNPMGFCFAAAANGVQNSLTSTATANWIRTTHYTGISSDVGTFVGQILRGNKQNLPRLRVFLALSGFFWMGGFISFYCTQRFSGSCLLFASVLYSLLGLAALFQSFVVNKDKFM